MDGLTDRDLPIAVSALTLPFVLLPPAPSKVVRENAYDDQNDEDHHKHAMHPSIALRSPSVQPWQGETLGVREARKPRNELCDLRKVVSVDGAHQGDALRLNLAGRGLVGNESDYQVTQVGGTWPFRDLIVSGGQSHRPCGRGHAVVGWLLFGQLGESLAGRVSHRRSL